MYMHKETGRRSVYNGGSDGSLGDRGPITVANFAFFVAHDLAGYHRQFDGAEL